MTKSALVSNVRTCSKLVPTSFPSFPTCQAFPVLPWLFRVPASNSVRKMLVSSGRAGNVVPIVAEIALRLCRGCGRGLKVVEDVPFKGIFSFSRWWNFKYFWIFTTIFGEMIQFWLKIFKLGWNQHHPTPSSFVRLLEGKASFFYWGDPRSGGRSFAKILIPFGWSKKWLVAVEGWPFSMFEGTRLNHHEILVD